MKTLNLIRTALLVTCLVTIWSCQKESMPDIKNMEEVKSTVDNTQSQQLPFKGDFGTYFNFVPDIAGGWTPPNPAPAWYPGGGSGNLTHVGTCQTFFNQYTTFGPGGLQSVAAPVNMFFATQLAAAGYTIPNTVSTIFYNGHGKSVWSTGVGASSTTPVSPYRVEFTANHIIIGGTGKFAGATGQFILSGYFNPQNPNDAGFSVDGWIVY